MAKRRSKNQPSRSSRRARLTLRMRQDAAIEQIRIEQGRDPMFNIDDAWSIYKANGLTDAQARQMLIRSQRAMQGPTRKIDGKQFTRINVPTKSKQSAQAVGEAMRRQQGGNVQIIPYPRKDGTYWAAFHRPRTRSFSASLADRIAEDEMRRSRPARTRRSFWQRLTQRRVKKDQTAELDAQELKDFYRFREELLRKGTPEGEAYTQAKEAAQLTREEAEDQLGRSKRAKELEEQIRLAQEREDIANYEWARESYNEGVPISTVVKYNSLEIATTSTGLAVGAGIAAATATAGVVPVAGIVGFALAKVIRGNVGGLNLKRGVNRTLDAVDTGIDGAIESVRVSKDQGQGNPRLLWLVREPSRVKPKKPKTLKQMEREERRREARVERDRVREIRREARDERRERRAMKKAGTLPEDEPREQITIPGGAGPVVKTYKDNATNRRLGRVGQPIPSRRGGS